MNTPPCEVIEVSLEPGHEKYVAKVCYEIGNRHAPLFWGDQENTFITIYNEPMMVMLEKIHGVKAEKKTVKLDFDQESQQLSTIIIIEESVWIKRKKSAVFFFCR